MQSETTNGYDAGQAFSRNLLTEIKYAADPNDRSTEVVVARLDGDTLHMIVISEMGKEYGLICTYSLDPLTTGVEELELLAIYLTDRLHCKCPGCGPQVPKIRQRLLQGLCSCLSSALGKIGMLQGSALFRDSEKKGGDYAPVPDIGNNLNLNFSQN
jgi:hypothetical protein